MNRTEIIIIFFFGVTSCGKNPYNSYGSLIPSHVSQSYVDVLKHVEAGPVENVSLKGTILTTCPKKGCWMDIKVSEMDTIKVRFQDYGFFVPKEGLEGKQTIIKGAAKMDTLSVEMLRHYASDAGKTKDEIDRITEPEFVMQFTAEGVLIER